MAREERRLGLSGKTLVFPDGRAYCLVCGRRPWGARRVAFRDPEFARRKTSTLNRFLELIHPILAWANMARLVSFEIEAPLCFWHLWKSRWRDVAIGTLIVSFLVLLYYLKKQGALPDQPSGLGSLLKGALVAIALLAAWLYWKKARDPAGLPFQARRETDRTVILSYRDSPPPA